MQIHNNTLIAECSSYDFKEMLERTENQPNFLPGKAPQYQTEAISFYTTFYNLNWGENGRIPVEEVANRVNSTLEKSGVNGESSERTSGNLQKGSERTSGNLQKGSERTSGNLQKGSEKSFGETVGKPKNIGKTAQKIIDFVISDPSISAEAMAYKIGISSRTVKKQIAKLRSMGILSREGADFGGYWRIVIKPE